MTSIKTSELSGAALDWAVAMAENWAGADFEIRPYSTDWAQGGPIIEREKMANWPDEEGGWFASANEGQGVDYHGPTPLIAAMRCFVACCLGDTVDAPDELI